MSNTKKIWNTISSRNDLMEVAEEIGNHFKSKIKDSNGVPARYISVKNIDFNFSDTIDGVEAIVEIDYLSDQGDSRVSILFKQFKNQELLQDELSRYADLEAKCMRFIDIDVLPLIKIDKKNNYVIYELINGYTVKQLSLSNEILYFLLGKIYGVIHGSTCTELPESKIREYFVFLLTNLPFTDEEKDSIITLLDKEYFSYYSSNFAACNISSSINENNILIVPKVKNITIEGIKKGDALSVYIIPNPSENLIQDRLIDIAILFNDMVFDEFYYSGKVELTKREIRQFLRGYASIMKLYNIPSFVEMYPNGFPLNLHFMAVAWLNEASKAKYLAYSDVENKETLMYTYYMLTQDPFEEFYEFY